VFPVPTELRINLSVVTCNSSKAQDETGQSSHIEKQKDSGQVYPKDRGFGEFKN
jgi:hypothetical protein